MSVALPDDDEPVELTNFDIPQVHLVDDPANGRRILTRKGVAMGAPPFKKKEEKPPAAEAGAEGAAPEAEGAPADAAAATGEEPKKPAPNKAMKLAAPARGAWLATLQGMGNKIAELMQRVDSAEPTDDMSVPSDLQEAIMGIQQDMDIGMSAFPVAKRRVATPVNNFFRSLLDTYNKALDHLPIGGAPALDPAAVAAPVVEAAPVGIDAQVTKAVDAKLSQFNKELEARDATIKSLQADLHAIRRTPAASGLLGAGATPPAAARSNGRKSAQEFSDLNQYRAYCEQMDAVEAAPRR